MLNVENVHTMFYLNDPRHPVPYVLFIECDWGNETRIYHTYLQTTIPKIKELEDFIKKQGWSGSELVCAGESIAHHVEIRKDGDEMRIFLYDWLRYECHQAVYDRTINDIVEFRC